MTRDRRAKRPFFCDGLLLQIFNNLTFIDVVLEELYIFLIIFISLVSIELVDYIYFLVSIELVDGKILIVFSSTKLDSHINCFFPTKLGFLFYLFSF